jgi:hypothetical protein
MAPSSALIIGLGVLAPSAQHDGAAPRPDQPAVILPQIPDRNVRITDYGVGVGQWEDAPHVLNGADPQRGSFHRGWRNDEDHE